MIKPSDFSLGVIDFLAVLVPGAAIVWLAMHYAPADIVCAIDVGFMEAACGSSARPELALRATVFAFASFVLGHFIFMFGSALDDSYDRWRERKLPRKSDRAYLAAQALVAALTEGLQQDPDGKSFSVLKWTTNYLRVHCPDAHSEVERLEATQKLFRSLVVVGVIVSLHFLIARHAPVLALLAAAFSVLSYYRYCDQRLKMTELSFASAVIVHATLKDKAGQ